MNIEWYTRLEELLRGGELHKPRGFLIKELLNQHFTVDMRYPILSIAERKLGYRFMVREAWWIMDGRNSVDTITNYSKAISTFSNDGIHFDGAYGPRVVDQIRYIVDTLEKDPDSRQAVMTIWRPNPRESKDIPCTISVQWFIRNGKIYCIDNMRSSDIWLGLPYDIFNFTMLTGYIMLCLKQRGIVLELGDISINAGSQHIYEQHFEKAESIIDSIPKFTQDYKPFNPYEFDSPKDLKDYLKSLSEKDKDALHYFKSKFAQEFISCG